MDLKDKDIEEVGKQAKLQSEEVKNIYNKAWDAYNNNDFQVAKNLLISITKDTMGPYCAAQLLLAELNKKIGMAEEVKACYKNIPPSSLFYYYIAQKKLYEFTRKRSILLKIGEDSPMYNWAQFELGLIEYKKDKPCLLKINNHWNNISKDSFEYKIEAYIIELLGKIYSSERNIRELNFDIVCQVESILKKLKIESQYEDNIAHYTNLTVSKLLLSQAENEKIAAKEFRLKSSLRLNTITLMNDPEEGLLINKLLSLDNKITTQNLAFIACFTLHHDSLNQFRLYAKEEQKEALGVSLVLGKEFFAEKHNVSYICQTNFMNVLEELEVTLHENSKMDEKITLDVMPLYRCIYFDPTSGLVKVAQREEWSFQREFKVENKNNCLEPNLEADGKWQQYSEEISEIEKNVKLGLKELSALVEKLRIHQLNEQEKEVLAEILLPLRYLIKHMAFKEEQECRIVYVTQMDNKLIQYDEKNNRIYIDYEPSIMEHLEKIYIAPKAKDEKMIFEYLCSRGQEVRKGKPLVKVKISQNPFR